MTAPGTWNAGFAARDITPRVGAQISGFVIRQQPAVAIHDPLFARAIVLDDGHSRCCLLVLDLIGVDLDLTHAIRRAVSQTTDLLEAHIAILATHTHGGPAVLPRVQLGYADPHYRTYVVQQAHAAATTAVHALRPTTLRFGRAHETTVARNRRVPTGPVDPDVPVLLFQRNDIPIALFTSYACHPVTLGPDNLQITRDYPGELITELEQRYPNTFVAFATGCCGQINTGHRAEDSLRSGSTSKRTFEEAQRIGRTLALATMSAVEQAMAWSPIGGRLRVVRSVINLPLTPLPAGYQAELESWTEELSRIAGQDPAREAVLRALIAWGNSLGELELDCVEVEAMCIGLGDTCIALYPGEMFVEFGLELKAAFPERRVVTLSYANAAPGYLPHRTAYPAGGYEVCEAYRFYGRAAPFPPEAGEMLQEEMLRLAQEVLA